jgi:3-(3-hydroxy-phenyl)propionate hydroxylase
VRRAVYEFHARRADRWRAGRVLLAGDAAHVMPPFAGLGLAAGARDAAGLAWRLAAVVAGAPASLLDTYEAERRPEVRAATWVALWWGRVLQTRRPGLARARDSVLFALDPTPAGAWLRTRARPSPALRRGALLRPRRRGTGVLFPQPWVVAGGRRIRLDDVLGDGWAVLGSLEPAERAAWEAAGARIPELDDADGAIAAWLARHRATWVALRPDRHVFGCGRAGEAARAAAAARAWLGR